MNFIKSKNKDPRSSDFSKQELVINSKKGKLFYKSDKGIHSPLTPNEHGMTSNFSSSGIFVSGSIIPDGSGSHDLGSSTNPWKDLHIITSSIRFYDSDGEVGKLQFTRDEGLQILKVSASQDTTDEDTEYELSIINGGFF